jgi:hypothetical protein
MWVAEAGNANGGLAGLFSEVFAPIKYPSKEKGTGMGPFSRAAACGKGGETVGGAPIRPVLP